MERPVVMEINVKKTVVIVGSMDRTVVLQGDWRELL
jgi:hypothetical protein